MSNELHLSKSLYLQQHAENPVHWKQWSQDVLDEAELRDKLVLISIGYSSCHWCHLVGLCCEEVEKVLRLDELKKSFMDEPRREQRMLTKILIEANRIFCKS